MLRRNGPQTGDFMITKDARHNGLAIAAVVIAAIAFLCPQTRAQAVAGPDFSADQTTTTISGGHPQPAVQTKFYRGKGRIRVESVSSRGTRATILDPIHGESWSLMPEQKFALDMSAGLKVGPSQVGWTIDPNDPCVAYKGQFTCKKVGAETVAGRPAEKWELSSTGTIAPAGTFPWYVWVDKALWMITKQESPIYSMQLTNIKVGAQPDSLFDVPADYRKGTMKDLIKSGAHR
jgi:hypothetical protein